MSLIDFYCFSCSQHELKFQHTSNFWGFLSYFSLNRFIVTMQIMLTLKAAIQNTPCWSWMVFWIVLFQNYVQQPCIIFIMSTVTDIEMSFIEHYWCISKWAHIYTATAWQWVVKQCWFFRTWAHRKYVIYWYKLEYNNIYIIDSFENF